MKILAAVLSIVIAGFVGAVLFIYLGVYNIAATEQHTRPVYLSLEQTLKYSVRRRSVNVQVPPLNDPSLRESGFYLYRQHCEKCHGGPGVAPEDFAKGLTPVPLSLVEVAWLWKPADLYWTTKYGIKMTGMPAWEYRLSEEQLWAVVAFLNQLRNLSPQQYQAMRAAKRADAQSKAEQEIIGPKVGDPKRGEVALRQYACHSCHTIPGVVGADKVTGPSLEGMASRMYIAGALQNTPENMLLWIRHPPQVDPLTAMPDMGVTQSDAIDILAYLYTLK